VLFLPLEGLGLGQVSDGPAAEASGAEMARLQNLLLSAAAVGGIVRAAARLERWALERAVVLLSRLLMLPGARCALPPLPLPPVLTGHVSSLLPY